MVIQDLDAIPGYGAFWGEVQTNIHKALGCLDGITNGSIRESSRHWVTTNRDRFLGAAKQAKQNAADEYQEERKKRKSS